MQVQLSKEWVSGQIESYGNNHEKQVTSPRKKIYDHRDSGSHKTVVDISNDAGTEKLKTVITDSQKQAAHRHYLQSISYCILHCQKQSTIS